MEIWKLKLFNSGRSSAPVGQYVFVSGSLIQNIVLVAAIVDLCRCVCICVCKYTLIIHTYIKSHRDV